MFQLSGTVMKRAFLLVGLLLAFLAFLDSSATNLIGSQVLVNERLTASQLQLMQSSYVLTIAATLLPSGLLVKRFGPEMIGLLGSAIFGLSSAGLSLFGDAFGITALRILQGLGAALIVPALLTWLNTSFEGRARRRAFLVWGSMIGSALAFGPLLASLVSTTYGWRAVFAVNIPVAIAFSLVAFRAKRVAQSKENPRFDVWGVVFSFVSIGLISLGLELMAENIGRNYVLPVLVLSLGALFLLVLIWHSSRRAKNDLPRLLNLSAWKNVRYRTALICAMLVTMGEVGILFTVPIYLQNVRVWDALDVAGVLAIIGLGALATFALDAWVGTRLKPHTWLVLGLGLEIASGVWFALIVTADQALVAMQVALFVYGLGVGLTAGQIAELVFDNASEEQSADTSAMVSVMRQVGAVLGVALIGSLMLISMRVNFAANLESFGTPKVFAGNLADNITRTAGANIYDVHEDLIERGMPKPIADDMLRQAREDLGNGSRIALNVSSGLLVISLVSVSLIATKGRRKR